MSLARPLVTRLRSPVSADGQLVLPADAVTVAHDRHSGVLHLARGAGIEAHRPSTRIVQTSGMLSPLTSGAPRSRRTLVLCQPDAPYVTSMPPGDAESAAESSETKSTPFLLYRTANLLGVKR